MLFVAIAGNGTNNNFMAHDNDVTPTYPGSYKEPGILTVAATDSSDNIASFSNFGASVDIYAPGVSVLSASLNGRTATLSGTSMASPHVAGLAAYYLGLGRATAANMCNYIVSTGLRNVISGVPTNTVNLLAQNGLA